MVKEYTGDKGFGGGPVKVQLKDHNKYNSGHGHGHAVKKPTIVANGSDLIISDEDPGTKNNRYIRFKNVSISELCTSRGQDAFTQATIKLNVYGGFDTKIVEIPDHIPEDQWSRFVQGVFDAKE